MTESIPGLGIADLETVREPGPRLIGNASIEVDLGEGPLVLAGFENHGGRTRLGPDAAPLGRVLKGHGNNDRDGYEGVKRLNLIGTYLHGPLLPKNAWLADHLIATRHRAPDGHAAPSSSRFATSSRPHRTNPPCARRRVDRISAWSSC